MKSWSAPSLPAVSTTAGADTPFALFDTAAGKPLPIEPAEAAGMYVCGITPYDATHLGHAATYVTFDLAHRVMRDMGMKVTYVQNVTDVDDPLLERATRDGVDWRDLATSEIELFHGDMEALAVLPPQHYIGVVESMGSHAANVTKLVESGAAYASPVPEGEDVADGAADIYLDLAQQPTFGDLSHWSREEMLDVYADRGGDPERPGKRDALDPLLWRAERAGEPAWNGGSVIGRGRPGWHIECTSIALEHLRSGFTLQGGGTDLVFPHHEMSAVQAVALTGQVPFARHYAHQGMVGYEGEKMSKSKGNLVKVSVLRREGVDPMAIRLVMLAQHYRSDWEYTDAMLEAAKERLARWRAATSNDRGDAEAVVADLRRALRNDLDTASALAAVDAWCETAENEAIGSGGQVREAVDALLGVRL
ncbi:cysteine--1-D-myo-inosityl 2-amino-2-deoxy-alpha-D-glucopyranoside ligase [Dermacoccus abyssi]|uniref:cysteine--1-D-myo-inosityl 2-amino-2-deoxy-alpha-D-glucopyranoside ligase n=1 Tax=Dermacoccus abyssi TaxID=322596 RepID=UPI0021A296C5|nr:cysteine--1-D-myo-inosityl 2-amino-2-deoxy-alpha-D-glucopyranoside ligase [Dermacoccus abyssi]